MSRNAIHTKSFYNPFCSYGLSVVQKKTTERQKIFFYSQQSRHDGVRADVSQLVLIGCKRPYPEPFRLASVSYRGAMGSDTLGPLTRKSGKLFVHIYWVNNWSEMRCHHVGLWQPGGDTMWTRLLKGRESAERHQRRRAGGRRGQYQSAWIRLINTLLFFFCNKNGTN